MIDRALRPKLARKARLRLDHKTGRYMLLFPEKGLVLNATGTEIVKLCTGEHTVNEIVELLVTKYPSTTRETLDKEVLAFLGALSERGLLEGAS